MAIGRDILGKLVRDKIPEIIEASGRSAQVRQLIGKAFERALHDKLAEETAELCDAKTAGEVLEEAADVLEVVRAIASGHGHDLSEVIRAADAKRAARGGFDSRLWLEASSTNSHDETAPFAVEEFLEPLEFGPRYRFADWPNLELPMVAAGVYTVWEGDEFVYVGFAGMKLTARDIAQANSPKKAIGLRDRLNNHASGARSGDQFCVYICDRFVLEALSEDDRDAIHQGDLRLLNVRTRQHIRERYDYRFVLTPDGKAARVLERAVQRGALTVGRPLLNPL
jgi:predicted house-cleaning noncanonical NTP pyrophosphatase (MazG superfamily)